MIRLAQLVEACKAEDMDAIRECLGKLTVTEKVTMALALDTAAKCHICGKLLEDGGYAMADLHDYCGNCVMQSVDNRPRSYGPVPGPPINPARVTCGPEHGGVK